MYTYSRNTRNRRTYNYDIAWCDNSEKVMIHCCTECDWTGEKEELFIDRDNDPYDPDTQWYELCPICYSLAESVKDYVSKD